MSIYRSDHPNIDIPAVSITDYVLRHAERLRDKLAFVDGPRDLEAAATGQHPKLLAHAAIALAQDQRQVVRCTGRARGAA